MSKDRDENCDLINVLKETQRPAHDKDKKIKNKNDRDSGMTGGGDLQKNLRF